MDRVIEIVNYVMKQVLFLGDKTCSERELVDTLVQLGYQPEEIVLAFKLLYSLPRNLKSDTEVLGGLIDTKDGQRVFSQNERNKLSFSCQGEIIRLMNESLLTMAELENILAEALKMEAEEVGLHELEQILFKVVNDQERLLMILPHQVETGCLFLLN